MYSGSLTAEQERVFDLDALPTMAEIVDAFGDKETATENLDKTFFLARQNEDQWEVLNEELVVALAGYLTTRLSVVSGAIEDKKTILDLGAGKGKLSHFLRVFLSDDIEVIAVDSGTPETHHPVEAIDHKEALERYQPDIVIASWMPYLEDWTQDIRDTDSVKEYILIGEARSGCCGDPWLTWGNADPLELRVDLRNAKEEGRQDKVEKIEKEFEAMKNSPAPYKKDGFVVVELRDLEELQTPIFGVFSTIYSFRRTSAAE
ncbi:hypothetical protein HZB74_02490 [Candidatus Saccharibacteria bacterium]|nr:hypothetical protein [Candidatus Saccharibacteria bacterium]